MKKLILLSLILLSTLSYSQNVGISSSGVFVPTSLFDIEGKFQVNSSGNLIKINNLTGYSWPTSHATGFLSNNGTGTLTWSDGSTNFIQNQVIANQAAGFRITGNGLFSSTSKVNIGSINIPGAKLEVNQETSSGINTRFISYGTVNEVELRRSQGTLAAPTIIGSAGVLGRIWGIGYDGVTWRNSSNISFEVDAVSSVGDMPGRIVFFTAPDGTSVPLERMRISNSGNVGISTTNPASTLKVDGSMAGRGRTIATTIDVTLAATDYFVYTTGTGLNTVNMTLPTLTSPDTDGRVLVVKCINNISATWYTFVAAGGNTIQYAPTYSNPLSNNETVMFISMGTVWHMINHQY